jgi:hypothetical protein
MTLQYRPSDGKLLYHKSGPNAGKLMAACCCPECDPSLPTVLHLSISMDGTACQGLFPSSVDLTYDTATKSWISSDGRFVYKFSNLTGESNWQWEFHPVGGQCCLEGGQNALDPCNPYGTLPVWVHPDASPCTPECAYPNQHGTAVIS